MKLISGFLKICDIDLQPKNSQTIDIELAKTVLYPGAHIAAANTHEHFHHGIVVDLTSTDITIIHFWGVKKRDARIQTTTLPIFLAGGIQRLGIRTRRLYLVNYQDDTSDKQQETSQRAKDMLDEPDKYKYNLFRLNCESFAYFCRTNKWSSEQATILRSFFTKKIKHLNKRDNQSSMSNRDHSFETIVPGICFISMKYR